MDKPGSCDARTEHDGDEASVDPRPAVMLHQNKTAHEMIPDSVWRLTGMMKAQDVTPTRMAYNVVLSALGTSGKLDDALALFEEMKLNGLQVRARLMSQGDLVV
jgi:pentatricopeptide repeat protein